MQPFTAEVIGTTLLVLLGDGVVATVLGPIAGGAIGAVTYLGLLAA